MKVAIIIITYNLPSEVTILQIEAIRKYCKDTEYEIQIVDNSTDKDVIRAIKYHAENLGVGYMKTNASSKNGSDSHAFASGLSYQKFKDEFDILFYLDHDAIPVSYFSCEKILEDKFMAGLGQQKGEKTYMWPGCVMIKLCAIDRELVNFSPSKDFGLDTGGNLYYLIDKYGKDQCIFFNEEYWQNPYFNGKENHYATINDGMFIHYISSSGWKKEPDLLERINSLINVTREKMDAN